MNRVSGVIAMLVTIAAAGCSAPAASPPPAAQTVTVTAPAVTETVTVPGPARTTVTAPAVTETIVAEPPAPKVAIEEGTWMVGTDIAAGRYRTIDAVTDGCYWLITRSGTNGDDIIANDLPTGGRPSVTLRKGQDFTTKDCGSWAKAG